MDITSPTPINAVTEGRDYGISAKDAAFNAEARIQARAVEDARGLGRIDRDLLDDIKGNLIAVKDANLFTIDRLHDNERRILVTQHETRELARVEGEKTRELLHAQKVEALAREVADLKVEGRIGRLESMLIQVAAKVGATIVTPAV